MITGKIVGWLIRQKMITSQECELYMYAMQCFYFRITPLLLAILVGVIMKYPIEGLILGFTICIIRKYSGGYHANSIWGCHIVSIIVLVIGLFMMPYIHIGICFFCSEILAILELCVLSPMESKNHPMVEQEKEKYKKITKILIMICACLEIIFLICSKTNCAIAIGNGVVATAISQSICLIKRSE